MTDKFVKALTLMANLGYVTIHNARGEFACNSSSSHSIIVLPRELNLTEFNTGYEANHFGENEFLLTTSTGKIRYLAAFLEDNPSKERISFIKKLNDELREAGEADDSAVVEAQRSPSFPQNRYGKFNVEFATAFANFLKDPRVVIAGGSDSGNYIPEAILETGYTLLNLADLEEWIAREDHAPVGSNVWWSLFNKKDGTKFRIKFNVDSFPVAKNKKHKTYTPEKTTVPELVDIKVTDRCAFEKDCGFCYMGSTIKGSEASAFNVTKLLTSFSKMGVFEIAFGGGEPTLWKHMEEIMAYTRSVGMVPNFTTKNIAAIYNKPELISLAGSVAISVNDSATLDKLDKAYLKANDSELLSKITVQVIPEIVDDKTLESIFAWVEKNESRITLLGYKETGRGLEFSNRIKRKPGFWLKYMKEKYIRVAIDTVLAEKCEKELQELSVPEWCYHTQEGKFSMYVDAVLGKSGPSSYCLDAEMHALNWDDDLDKQLQTNFLKY